MYQSNEHEGWLESSACKICETVIDKLISQLNGYEQAPWGIP